MSYEQMANVYDQLMADAPYDKWRTFTNEVIKQFDKTVESIADLGCGTGQITTRLAQDGYQMTGVDYSSEMLSVAEQHANNKNLSIQWINQDLRMLEGLNNLDLAVSYCDVINYITEEDELLTVFKCIADALKPGGLFIFDIHSLYHVQHNFVNQTFADVTDDLSYIWFCSEGDEQGEMYHDLTFFVENRGTYLRFDEFHHQRTFSVEFYSQLLAGVGLETKHVSSDFSLENENLDEQSERIFIVAEK